MPKAACSGLRTDYATTESHPSCPRRAAGNMNAYRSVLTYCGGASNSTSLRVKKPSIHAYLSVHLRPCFQQLRNHVRLVTLDGRNQRTDVCLLHPQSAPKTSRSYTAKSTAADHSLTSRCQAA